MPSDLPPWASYSASETRAARRGQKLPDALYDRLRTLADLPGLTPRQRAKLCHRSLGWVERNFGTDTFVKPEVTFEQARALVHAVGWSGISSPFLLDQIKLGITQEQVARVWNLKSSAAAKALTRTHHAWWEQLN